MSRTAALHLRVVGIVGVLATVGVAAGCRPAAGPVETGGEGSSSATPARVVVTQARTDLVFTWIDAAGQFHDVTSIAEVPESARASVLVRDLSKSPDELRSAEFVYLADLRTPDEDGRFPCGAVSRRSFERRGWAEAAANTAVGSDAAAGHLVVVYATSWCGVCAQAKQYLQKKGIPFLEKDVEQDPTAAAELSAKARAKGVEPRGVPVIDVAGELMLGFDPDRLGALLEAKGLSRTL